MCMSWLSDIIMHIIMPQEGMEHIKSLVPEQVGFILKGMVKCHQLKKHISLVYGFVVDNYSKNSQNTE